jgi:hypothetical protein
MSRLLAQVITVVISLLGVIHLYWAFGSPHSYAATIPEIEGRRAFSPSRCATIAVALALFIAATLVAISGRLLEDPFPSAFVRVPTILLGVLLVARAIGDFRLLGFFKQKNTSRFARLDTMLYSPLCLALGVGVLFVVFYA